MRFQRSIPNSLKLLLDLNKSIKTLHRRSQNWKKRKLPESELNYGLAAFWNVMGVHEESQQTERDKELLRSSSACYLEMLKQIRRSE
uniref:Ovule protein n=1 Tax=Caenorhabditis tropicalis TaxID=1561998 RepID=A0A1I7TC25_9PELO